MRSIKYTLLAGVAAVGLAVSVPASQAQVSFGISVGQEPVCPYGYYDYSPYRCAPYGYYGPEWFNNGVFIGTGRWYHGPEHFHGYVNRSYDRRYGYHGAYPNRGEHWRDPDDHWQSFHGSHWSDGHGHYHVDRGHDHDHDHDHH
ncbi:MAG: hypothetical protein V4555_15865 [Acidobacteriota bacterium]